jgi:transcription-repair coupling factor (superfamily II helicase)
MGILKFWQLGTLYDLKQITYSKLLAKLAGFTRVEKPTQPGEFSIRGDIVSLWPIGYDKPLKLEFFGEQLEQSYTYDELYGRKLREIHKLFLSDYQISEVIDREQITISHDITASDTQIIIFTQSLPIHLPENIVVDETDYTFPQLFFNRQDLLIKEVERLIAAKWQVQIYSHHSDQLPNQLKDYLAVDEKVFGFNIAAIKKLPAGFESQRKHQLLLTDREIYGTIHLSQIGEESSKTLRILKQFEQDIEVGDYIVHEDYGIGIYRGLTQETSSEGLTQDYLLVEYGKGDQLFIPISQVNKLTKFVNDTTFAPVLTRLGKKEWDTMKRKVKKSVGILARELVAHYAQRQVAKAEVIEATDSKAYEEFIAKFPYELTGDQHRSTNEILSDIGQEKPMNRLLIGDVGFGKTEVFLRAAFKACEQGKQVAILCPTTILTAQHYAVALERFKDTKFKIVSLSRFNTPKRNAEIVDDINRGEIDIIIGTHRLLSNDVKFKDLGLLVVDEEQKFGVGQKEKIKKINYGVHVLSVTATPIPRTLSMALSSIHDISIISTAPTNRRQVTTSLVKNDWNQVQSAIITEVERGGQVYFLHNEVKTIQSIVARLGKMLPGVSITYGHGQMPGSKLDHVMTEFYTKKHQVLVATTIIENGLDMPNVNTIIVNKAHKFGLSQLYQLRGRVGRSHLQGYCYLFYEGKDLGENTLDEKGEKITPTYMQRLETILNSTDLGSGFKIASKDLEIRGAGNLLGKEQSGHINTIGYTLYMRMLSAEIEKLQAGVGGTIVSF